MIKKLLPLILLIVGAGVGAAAGMFLRPEPEPEPVAEMQSEKEVMDPLEEAALEKDSDDVEYAKFSNQFVVPVVKQDRVAALVVMTLSLEVPAGKAQAVYSKEPKLRDAFLQVLFDHANIGGFDGAFTSARSLNTLRQALREKARKEMGDQVYDVLISDIARQDY